MEHLKTLYSKYREIINYLIFGGLTTIVSWASFSLFVKGLGMTDGIAYNAANVMSWVLAVLFAFVTNKLFVFESKTWAPAVALREFVSFISARLFTGAIEWVGVPYLTNHGLGTPLFGVKGLWAKITVSVVVVVLNYVFSKFLIFIKKQS